MPYETLYIYINLPLKELYCTFQYLWNLYNYYNISGLSPIQTLSERFYPKGCYVYNNGNGCWIIRISVSKSNAYTSIGKYFCIPLLHTCCQICILWNIILFHKTMEKEAFEGLRMVCFIMNNIKRFKMYVLTEATSWFHILVTISKFKVRKQR